MNIDQAIDKIIDEKIEKAIEKKLMQYKLIPMKTIKTVNNKTITYDHLPKTDDDIPSFYKISD